MSSQIENPVVVITGASSGIGRATALEFAIRGGRMALAARRREALEEVAEECGWRGGEAIVVPTDVTDEEAVKRLASQAIEGFGGVDVWVNNAAVSAFGRMEEVPTAAMRRVMDTNFFGYAYGARAVLPHFRERGRGVLINVDSVVASAPQPYTSAYVASKYAIRALSECLRMELALDDASDIHVCTVLPASIDTPLFQQAANYTGRAVQALQPAYEPEDVAEAIVELVDKPKREVVVGAAGRLMMAQHAVAPAYYERSNAVSVDKGHFQDRPADRTDGNLFEPMPEHARVHGGWRQETNGGGKLGKAAMAGLALAVPAAVVWAVRSDGISLPWR